MIKANRVFNAILQPVGATLVVAQNLVENLIKQESPCSIEQRLLSAYRRTR